VKDLFRTRNKSGQEHQSLHGKIYRGEGVYQGEIRDAWLENERKEVGGVDRRGSKRNPLVGSGGKMGKKLRLLGVTICGQNVGR